MHTVLLRLLWRLLVRRELVLLRMAVVLVRAARGEAVSVAVRLLLLLLLLHAEATVHVLAKVGKGLSAVQVMAGVTVVGHHGHARGWPVHGIASGSGRRLLAARLGHGVIDLGGVDSALVRSSLVLHHGGFPAEALQAAIVGAFVRALSRVDAAMPGQTGRV